MTLESQFTFDMPSDKLSLITWPVLVLGLIIRTRHLRKFRKFIGFYDCPNCQVMKFSKLNVQAVESFSHPLLKGVIF